MNLKVLNRLIKKSRYWHKRTSYSLFQRLANHFERKKQEIIFDVIDELKVHSDSVAHDANSGQSEVIWICWFQGLDSAPELVRRCIDSVHTNSDGLNVTIITDNNFSDYVTLPADIIRKYNSGLIGKAHFSDILRCCLLYEYGGVWLDATIFLTRGLSPSFLNGSFCSLRFKFSEGYGSISNGFWATYFLASEKKGYLIGCVKNVLINYWQEYDMAIDYFLMDYIFSFLFEKDPLARKIILSQPELGEERFLLKKNMSNTYTSELLDKFKQDSVGVYKLSYKEQYRITNNGQPTFYSKILDGSFRLL
ncbi:capsular biosynthesis protein [Leclercia sp. J807]|nr:capsular biosynthesis protein [Leclercia sp. J807]